MSNSKGPHESPSGQIRKPRHPDEADELELSAGGAVFRRSERGVELVIGYQTDWNTGAATVRLPKGHVEGSETLEQAAVREVREEAGRHARVLEKLDECHYAYENLETGEAISKRVVFFLMEDCGEASDHRDAEMNDIAWLPIAEAIGALTFDNERAIVQLAAARLDATGL